MKGIDMLRYIKSDFLMDFFFGGIMSFEELINITLPVKKDTYFVVNTGDIKSPGIHWIVIYVCVSHKKCIYFDPLAYQPRKHNMLILDFLMANGLPIHSLKYRLQGGGGKCGEFCIFFIYFTVRGVSLIEFIGYFSRHNLDYNDKIVTLYI